MPPQRHSIDRGRRYGYLLGLILHHEAHDTLRELDDGNSGPASFLGMEIRCEREGEDVWLEISEENGFVELAVGESKVFEASLTYTDAGVELRKGQKYLIAFRGGWLR